MGSWQLSGVWGDYETRSSTDSDTVSIQRSGLGANYSGSAELGDTSPFWDVSYWWYDYGSGDGTQKITTVKLGLKWPLGPVSMTSLWRKRWVDGGSPMAWDDYSDSEVFYQKAAIPFGEHWSFTVRGGYDLRESSLDEMYYRLSYKNTCCFRVDLAYRDDRVGDDDWAGLVFVLNAFPSHPFFLGAREIEEFVE
jgi:LPS-assembly protein